MRHLIKKFVETKKFETFIVFVIIINTIVLGIQTSDRHSINVQFFLEAINKICITIYILEAVLEIFAWRFLYFKNGWNVFDFVIVIIALVPISNIFTGLRLFRLLRAIRSFSALRILSNVKQLSKIIQAIISSLPGITWTVVLMVIFYYIYGLIGIHLFCASFPDRFSSFSVVFVTLFTLTTLSDWQSIVYPIVNIFPLAWLYFITFFTMSSYILLNLIVGIVVDNISNISEDEDNDSMKLDELKIKIGEMHKKIIELNDNINLLKKK